MCTDEACPITPPSDNSSYGGDCSVTFETISWHELQGNCRTYHAAPGDGHDGFNNACAFGGFGEAESPDCGACMAKSCCAESSACDCGTDCDAFRQCTAACPSTDAGSDPSCADACAKAHPRGQSDSQALDNCASASCPASKKSLGQCP